jgi:hypothetical protein
MVSFASMRGAHLVLVVGAVMVVSGLRGRMTGGPDGPATRTFDLICSSAARW